MEESLKFAEEYLVEKCEEHPEMQEKLEKTFALLAFEKPENSPFASLMELSHRQMVRSSFFVYALLLLMWADHDEIIIIYVSSYGSKSNGV